MHLADMGNMVTLITSRSSRFGGLSSSHKNLNVIYVDERTKKFEAPTVVKLFIKSIRFACFNNVDLMIGGDLWGNVVVNKLRHLKRVPYVFFALEFPQIITDDVPRLALGNKLENRAIEKADFVITHDKYHKQFLLSNFNLDEKKVLLLANASFTPEYRIVSDFICKRFGCRDNSIIVLHSGGFGKWFKCHELISEAQHWPEEIRLVFHTGRNMASDPYFVEAMSADKTKRCIVSDSLLSNEELDEMVSSASVGIALYSVDALGYRAELMGLAAGKIGNYLKCGIPVIATRLPSLQYLEDYGCGILVDNEAEIIPAIQKIVNDRGYYRENAFKCYAKLWHPKNYLPIIDAALKE